MRRRWVAAVGTATLVAGLLAGAASGSGAAQPTGPQNGRIFFSTGILAPNSDARGFNSQIWSMNPDGSDLVQLTHVRRGVDAGAPAVSPDGTTVAYTSDQNGDFSLFLMDADGRHQHQILSTPHTDYFTPSWSPDGATLVMTSCDNEYGYEADCPLVTVHADGTGLTTLLANRRINTTPSYSPNGRRIQFSSDQKGLDSAVWVMPATGGTPRLVTPPSLKALDAAWSPDGRTIDVAQNCCQANGNVFSISPDGSDLTKLTHLPYPDGSRSPRFSPDGRYVVFTANLASDHLDLFVMDADGRHVHRVTTDVVFPVQSSWGVVPGTAVVARQAPAQRAPAATSSAGQSPVPDLGSASALDGRIAFSDASRGVIETMNPDGTAVQEVTTEDEGYANQSAWTPDARHLIVSIYTPDFDRESLYLVNPDGSDLHPIFAEKKAFVYDQDPQVTPDGQWVIYSRFRPDPPGGGAVWAMHLDGTDRHPVTAYSPARLGAGSSRHAISPDGTRLAYQEFDLGGIASQIWVGDLDADAVLTDAHPITAVADEARGESWSADGQYVLGSNNVNHFGQTVDAFPVAGGDPVPLVRPPYPNSAFESVVSPSGRSIAYIQETAPNGVNDIYVANVDGSDPTLVNGEVGLAFHPQWGTAPLLPADAATPAAALPPPLSAKRLVQIRAALPKEVRAEFDR